mgnify:CR=1 FL=1
MFNKEVLLNMLKRFNVKELVVLAIFGAAVFVVDFIISTPISAAIGIPGSGYLVTSTIFVFLAVTGLLIVRKFGAFTLMAFVYSVLASFTPVFGLPPLYTILISVLSGLIGDVVVAIFRYKTPQE